MSKKRLANKNKETELHEGLIAEIQSQVERIWKHSRLKLMAALSLEDPSALQ